MPLDGTEKDRMIRQLAKTLTEAANKIQAAGENECFVNWEKSVARYRKLVENAKALS